MLMLMPTRKSEPAVEEDLTPPATQRDDCLPVAAVGSKPR
jgi:hypothetical protein